ncbi:phospho-N-acetylmuramoyl-pentapeptide-transferase [Eubacterium aggregans]|uniref:phospho-N-acetylmuramoyl-pentapeptide- transferase n=1 Tax=Eubacterium aggregans TaxID=81409 RepID=UPI003F3E37C2
MGIEKLTIIAFLVSFLFVWIITPHFLPVLRRLHFGQAIREEGPKSHMKKSGTPTMGGIVIQGGVLFSMIVMMIATGAAVLFPVIVMLFFGLIGFVDDYIKVSKKHNLGLRAWQKLVLQFGGAALIAAYTGLNPDIGTTLYLPIGGGMADLWMWYYPFTFIAVVAVVNAVNLTDGLDGLASGVTAVSMTFFAIAAIGLNLLSPAMFSGSLIGACLGFLRYNSNPADLFMGDTGSMALGGGVIAVAIMTQLQFFVLIAGFVFVMEALSVVIQVGYFKMSGGKHVFRMAPIHHHFELKGWSETRVVTVFWVAAALCVALAFLAYVA